LDGFFSIFLGQASLVKSSISLRKATVQDRPMDREMGGRQEIWEIGDRMVKVG
jgi:hypothetical protein